MIHNGVTYQTFTDLQIGAAQKQSTAYYRTELQTRSGSIQKEKDVLKFQKFQKNLCVIVPFSLTAQPAGSRISDFSKHTFQENVSFEYSEKVGSLPSHLII